MPFPQRFHAQRAVFFFHDMTFSFSADTAEKYGVAEAILIQSFQWWINKNRANGRHCIDGHTWTYNSVQAFQNLFPFWTAKQIRHALESLQKQGVLITGKHAAEWSDRTTWYAFKDETVWLERANAFAKKGKSQLLEKANDKCPEGQISCTVNKPVGDSKKEGGEAALVPKPSKPEPVAIPTELNTPEFCSAWDEYLIYRRQAKLRSLAPMTIEQRFRTFSTWGVEKSILAIRTAIESGWQGIFEPTNGDPLARAKANMDQFTANQRKMEATI